MSTTSSLVSCPICDKLVPEWYASDHMDRECKGASISQDRAAPNASKLPPPPPSSAGNKRTLFMASPSSRQKSSTPSTMFPSTKKARPSFDSNSEPSAVTSPVPLAQQRSHSDLSETADLAKRIHNTKLPLAERLRPLTLDSFVGQSELVGPGGILRILIESDRMSSCIFWGGPGLGKTTLARIIARKTSAAFKEMSAVTQNTVDVKKAIEEAGNLNRLTNKRTIVFLDEIHRFNKAQQDIFLPYLERGQIVLIGATTENPSFRLNGALLSRCRVFRLEALSGKDIASIAVRAAQLKQQDFGLEVLGLDDTIAKYISSISNGDARVAINVVDLAMNSLQAGENLDLDCVRRALQRTHVTYGEDEHYDLISALHKSVRGSDDNAALYWLGRMLQGGDDPMYVARRLVRMASEDIGLADNSALPLAMATLQACQAIGMPECDTILAHCVVYLARAPKSVESYKAFKNVKAFVAAENPWPVPMHIRNAPTRMMKGMGYGDGYKYNPNYEEPVEQEYLPEAIRSHNFFDKPE